MGSHLLKLHPSDNVAVTTARVPEGAEVLIDGHALSVQEDVPAGHKIALTDLHTGASVVKYGHPIGTVTRPVKRGCWLHTHTMQTNLEGVLAYRYEPAEPSLQVTDGAGTFDGYRRANGAVGTRNEVWVVNTVGCVNRSADRITRICREQFSEGIDGIHTFAHPYGCSQSGDDLESTRRILAGMISHPNAGGVLLLGLGCEDNQIDGLMQVAGDVDRSRIRHFNSQDVSDDVEHGVALVGELVGLMQHDRRTAHSTRDLIVGLKCGGSDSFSGVTANPLVGRIADRITAQAGGAILTEVPEMFGAEQTLMNRAVNERVFRDIERLVNDFKQYYVAHGRPIYENPSPGNLEGGLTTLEEKALGATRKGGNATVTEVLRYGERKRTPGLSLLEAPGNDAVSTTALVAAGATVILFTTGRGTPLGSPVPTIKISSNTALYERKPSWIDFNAGFLQDGSAKMEELAADLFDLLIDVASGRRQTKNEHNDYRDIAIWKTGVTL
ncbi:MAG: altronate dehydratase [Gemmatimonadales bacterium]|nr:altronate dehydratase [Gemmatimonadales bacterium]NIN12595.1 altronate dehydratase [Gemmatimonadales bacterium]NIN50934.1 altronate dehydratase [Gemmatimonadales bacterium]NIP08398.1 altronate dehydratase [Gemmatimonadales bacterium]NIQ99583.1 altronate dehydratase [Gemmatimonadales bacterium]